MPGFEQCLEYKVFDLPLFKGLPKSDVMQALEGNNVEVHHHGDSLFTFGADAKFFGLVLEGTYKLVLDNITGEEVIMHFGTTGEVLGIMSTMEGHSHFPFHAISIGTSRFIKIPKETFSKNWLHNPDLLNRYQNELQGRIFRGYEEKRLQKMELPYRVAHLLIYLSEYKSHNQNRISIQLTRRDIASYVGASIESIIRLLSDWSSKGFIKSENRFIEIRDRQALIQITHMNATGNHQYSNLLESLWQKTSINSSKLKLL